MPKKLLKKRNKQKKNTTAQIRNNVKASGFVAGPLARSPFAFGSSCNRPTRSRFSVVFLGPRANAELVPKFHVSLHASHAALPMVTLKILPYTNVTLTFDFGLDHLAEGEGAQHQEESNCKQRNYNLVMGPIGGLASR
jgi:hypothetical protein